jgi:hypothetical protein
LAFYKTGKADGIGFQLGDGWAGVDLDHCRNPDTGEMTSIATDVMTELRTFTDISPSQTGVKFILQGSLAEGHGNRQPGIEIYTRKRFFAITGHRIPNTPAGVACRQPELESLYDRFFGEFAKRPPIQDYESQPERDLTDDELIALAYQAKNGAKFRRLWEADIREYNDDDSRADAALCRLLAFWTGPSSKRVNGLFHRSALGSRPKWVEREDYRRRTVSYAIGYQLLADSFYRPSRTAIQSADASLTNEEVAQRALAIADELALAFGGSSRFGASFYLAKRLKHLSDQHPSQFSPAVRRFCEAAGRDDFEVFFADFQFAWFKVRKGEDDIQTAARLADESPCPHLNLSIGRLAFQLGTLCWHLHRLRGGKSWFLAPKQVCAWIRDDKGEPINAMQLSRLTSLLKNSGIIKCVDEDYRFRRTAEGPRRCKEYAFVGPPP